MDCTRILGRTEVRVRNNISDKRGDNAGMDFKTGHLILTTEKQSWENVCAFTLKVIETIKGNKPLKERVTRSLWHATACRVS